MKALLCSMRKLFVGVLALSLLGAFPAGAAKTIPYKNQKAGQFCKAVDIKKQVVLPDGKVLTCTKDGARSRWKA